MGRAALHLFHDQGTGRTDIETAPAGVLVVVAFGDPYRVGVGDGPLATAANGFVVGAQSRYGRSGLTGTAEGVQIGLSWSDAAAVFGPELPDFADAAVAVPDLAGGAQLVDRLAETPTIERARLVEEWLAARSRSHEAPSPLVVRALSRVEAGAGSVSRLAHELGCSRGFLHRGVHAATGQSPSTLIRIVRLHRFISLRAVADTRESLARTAAQAGYADHAHLCHEARQLAGRSPTALLGIGDMSTRSP